MARSSRARIVAMVAAAGLVLIVATFGIRRLLRSSGPTAITGAIVARNEDPHLERPVANATVTVTQGATTWKAVSAASGLFRIPLDVAMAAEEALLLHVEHPDYHPATITTNARDQIYVLRLTPLPAAEAAPAGPSVSLANIRVRYATSTASTSTVGAAVRTFDIPNKGNVPCEGRQPCSPDGKWKAAIGSLSLDAGEHKQFRNVRVSCIAGPCPFSAIEQDRFSRGGQTITASVRNWSDRVTYVIEAEVATTMETELIRHTYPVTFGRSMSFTLPPVATGITIEAEVDGSQVVFPLGPQLRLSWATCRFDTAADRTRQFRCVLKPGYHFK